MTTSKYAVLDAPHISMNSFYPRQVWTPTPKGAEDHWIGVEEGISLSSVKKSMTVVPGAGHNDLLYRGLEQCFGALRGFLFRESGADE